MLLDMTLLLMLACSGSTETEDTADTSVPCAGVQGTLEICVWYDLGDENPQVNAKAYATQAGDEDPLEGLTGEDGCLRIEVPAGTWEVWGATGQGRGDCIGEHQEVTLEACGTGHADVMTSDGCIG